MKLYAIGDLHLAHARNAEALRELRPHPEDGLILCGDVGETSKHLDTAFAAATARFRRVWWVPGNHELYTMRAYTELRGQAKYEECLDVARRYGVATPEDDFIVWEGAHADGGPVLVAPLFTLYDYSYCPEGMNKEEALKWAEDAGVVATDEFLLHPDPHPSREEWCDALITETEQKLEEANKRNLPMVLVNHWPLREDLVYIPRVPHFKLWCGSKRTEDWHTRFQNTKVVVSGHLHVPRTDWKDGVRFEECSLGYPKQWEPAKNNGKDINDLLREVWPGPPTPTSGNAEPQWRRWG